MLGFPFLLEMFLECRYVLENSITAEADQTLFQEGFIIARFNAGYLLSLREIVSVNRYTIYAHSFVVGRIRIKPV